ncbi:DUF3275 family protein [Neisseria sp. CCUG12390]|uniref:DUF3275 family protein n=1 Tax=Neisseria sp. CCUG12390 TaxID=3392035 RepID=UPI003A0FF8BA
MSIAIPGKLTVIERNGRNGVFTVGELQTSIGAFQIKHRVLDQFPEGSYDGMFYLTRIYNQSNFAKGRIWVSLYADLDWEALQIMAQNQEHEISESLHIAAEQEEHLPTPNQAEAPAVEPVTVSEAVSGDNGFGSEEDGLIDSMERLEQVLATNPSSIHLDASIDDRNLFRQLRLRVKEAGYTYFHAQTQSWRKENG